MRRSILSLVIATLAHGCASLECTVEEHYAVELRLTELGAPSDEPITIRYTVDGGRTVEIVDTEDVAVSAVDGECASRTRCSLGRELDGAYSIDVIRGRASVHIDTVVRADRCHVIPVELAVEVPDPG